MTSRTDRQLFCWRGACISQHADQSYHGGAAVSVTSAYENKRRSANKGSLDRYLPACANPFYCRRQSSDVDALSAMTLYDDHFNVLNTPVANYSGRLTLLEFVPDPASQGNGSFIAYGGPMSMDPRSGEPCPENSCFSLYFVYANFNTPAGFNNGATNGQVYSALVSRMIAMAPTPHDNVHLIHRESLQVTMRRVLASRSGPSRSISVRRHRATLLPGVSSQPSLSLRCSKGAPSLSLAEAGASSCCRCA